ncbi:MAG: hypothetical protein WKG06_11360 [Segetibacter sp.]
MTPEKFNSLQSSDKEDLLLLAVEVCQKSDELFNYELFKLNDFFIEVRMNYQHRLHKIVTAYNLEELPVMYEGEVS